MISMEKKFPGAFGLIKVMGIKSGESVLMLSDSQISCKSLEIIESTLEDCGANVTLYSDLPLQHHQELPKKYHEHIKEADVTLLLASQSWYHAPTRRKAKYEWGKRIGECYGLVTEYLLDGALTANFGEVGRKGENLAKFFTNVESVRVQTESGSDFCFRVDEVGLEAGIYDQPGTGGNLPAGEIYLIPAPGTVEGRIVFDVSIDLIGNLNGSNLNLDVQSGHITEISGTHFHTINEAVQKEPRLSQIAEIAFGTNKWAILGRNILEDEKRLGTGHVGFGNNTYFGGQNGGPHYDGVFKNPSILCRFNNGEEREITLEL